MRERSLGPKVDAPGVRRNGLRRNVGGDHQVFDLFERREGPLFRALPADQQIREKRAGRALEKAVAAEAKRNAWQEE